MQLPLSKRLQTCCNFIAPGDRVADIGCDHGYLGIHLLLRGVASSVIAADINEGPLQSAIRNARKYGVQDSIRFFLSDGVRNIPHDFDVMVCAGMGGDTMISILEAAPWLKSSQYRFVLQCQSKTPMLRQYLTQNGWCISEESVMRDGRFVYTVMEVLWPPDHAPMRIGQCYFPPALLKNPSKDVSAYFKWVVEGLRIATSHSADEQKHAALAELEALTQDPNLRFLTEE